MHAVNLSVKPPKLLQWPIIERFVECIRLPQHRPRAYGLLKFFDSRRMLCLLTWVEENNERDFSFQFSLAFLHGKRLGDFNDGLCTNLFGKQFCALHQSFNQFKYYFHLNFMNFWSNNFIDSSKQRWNFEIAEKQQQQRRSIGRFSFGINKFLFALGCFYNAFLRGEIQQKWKICDMSGVGVEDGNRFST